jgi:hypothetical protein
MDEVLRKRVDDSLGVLPDKVHLVQCNSLPDASCLIIRAFQQCSEAGRHASFQCEHGEEMDQWPGLRYLGQVVRHPSELVLVDVMQHKPPIVDYCLASLYHRTHLMKNQAGYSCYWFRSSVWYALHGWQTYDQTLRHFYLHWCHRPAVHTHQRCSTDLSWRDHAVLPNVYSIDV